MFGMTEHGDIGRCIVCVVVIGTVKCRMGFGTVCDDDDNGGYDCCCSRNNNGHACCR